MERGDLSTPVKLHINGEDVAIATPSGGLIFNPFHKEFMNRVGHATFSPGIFAHNLSPISKDDSLRSTPTRLSAPFVLSPDTQGILFPAEIDENPVFQLKLQEKLDTQYDEDVQDTIHSFFKSHLIAPSPDTVQVSGDRPRPSLPRTSSIIPMVTPKIKRNVSCKVDSVPVFLSEASVQTALSVPPAFDLDTLIRDALGRQVLKDQNVKENSDLQNSPKDQDETIYRPSFSACSVERPTEACSKRHYFLCMSCRKPHSLSQYTRRSLFSESSSFRDDSENRREDSSSVHRTLIPTCSAVPPPVHLSSSIIAGSGSPSDDSADLCSLLPDADADDYDCVEPRHYSHSPPRDQPAIPALRFHSTEELATTPPNYRSHCMVDPPKSGQTPGRAARRRFSLQSPCALRDVGGIASPNLSPILPSSSVTDTEEFSVDCTMHTPTTRHTFPSPVRNSFDISLPAASLNSRSNDPSLMDAE